MANTKIPTDAKGKYDDIRIELTDLDCESCGGKWFQLEERTETHVPDCGDLVKLSCCACGTSLAHPDYDDYEGPGEEA